LPEKLAANKSNLGAFSPQRGFSGGVDPPQQDFMNQPSVG
jgi:hypothetical protein